MSDRSEQDSGDARPENVANWHKADNPTASAFVRY